MCSDLSWSSGALALYVEQDHNFSDRLFITSGCDFSALVNLTTPSIVWDEALFLSFVSIKSNICTRRAVYKEGWLLSWGSPVHFHLSVKYRTNLWGHFSVLQPSSDTLKRTNLIHHFQGVILLFSRERTLCHCVLSSFNSQCSLCSRHCELFKNSTKLAVLTIPCALCWRTLAWPLTPKQAFWVRVPGVKAIFSFLSIPTFLHQHMFSAKLSALLPQSQNCSASYPGVAQFSSPGVLFPGFLRAGRRSQLGPATAAGEHLTLKNQNPSKNISKAEFLIAACYY